MENVKEHNTGVQPQNPLTEAQLKRIIDAIFQLLREIGVKFEGNPKVMDIFSDAGCEITREGVVKFPTDLVQDCIDSVGRSARIWNRPGTGAVEFSPRNRVFMAMISCLNHIDPETGVRRPSTKEDYIMISRVADALPDIDGVAGSCKMNETEGFRFAVRAANTSKPQLASFEDVRTLQAAIELSTALRGEANALREKPYFIASISQRPLCFEKRHSDQILTAVEHGIPLAVGTAGIGGATTPITVAGNVVHCFASDLAGLVLSQLVKKGSFCMIGSVIVFMDPQTGSVGVLNESTLAELVKCQIGRYWDIPLFNANAGLNMGLDFNQEAVLGLAVTMTTGIFSQATCNYLCGSIDGTLTFSIHSLLLCHELMGTARRIWKGVTVDDDTLAIDVTREVGPGGNFLGEKHTAVQCRKEISPIKYFVSKSFDNWDRGGRKDLKDIIGEDLQRILKTHKPEPLPPELIEKFNGILTRYGVPGITPQ